MAAATPAPAAPAIVLQPGVAQQFQVTIGALTMTFSLTVGPQANIAFTADSATVSADSPSGV